MATSARDQRGPPSHTAAPPSLEDQATIRFRDPILHAGFTALPNWILKKRGLTPGAKVLYALLLSYAWQSDRCWPGQARLAEDLDVTDRTIRTWLTELQDHRLLSVERRGLTQTNVYWIEPWSEGELSSDDALRSERKSASAQAERKQTSAQDRNTAAHQERKHTSDMKKTQGKKTQRKRDTAPTPTMNGHRSVGGDAVEQSTAPALRLLWRVALADLAEQIVPANYERWLARTHLINHVDGAAVVGVPDQICADQLARRFDPLVRRALADALGEVVAVRYQVMEA